MIAADRPSPFLWRPAAPRLLAGALAAVLAGIVGFVVVPVPLAGLLVKRGGYYVMLASFALFLHALWRHGRSRVPEPPPAAADRRTTLLAAGALVVASIAAVLAEPFRCKILYDEFVLQSTAFNLHFFRDAETMVRGYDIQGVFLSTDNYLDKRPYFFPFLVSLIHDLTGYRTLNAHLLNAGLLPVALGLAFLCGRRLAGAAGGLLAVLLLGALPLLGQNATGSGMELLNVAMLLAVLLLATDYLRAPGEEALAALLFATLLLAQTRYESALHAVPAAGVMLLGWARARRVILPWSAVLVPLLLIPLALQHRVVAHSPQLWELNEHARTRFSTDYFLNNLRGCGRFLFHPGWQQANSLLLTVAGLAALAWALVRLAGLVRRLPAGGLCAAAPAPLALAAFGAGILANVLLVFCYYWSSFDDPMAARFSLPLYLLLALLVVGWAGRLDPRGPATRVVLLVAGLYAVGVTPSRYAYHYYSHLGIDEIEWARRTVRARPPGSRLILTNRSTLPWLLDRTPAILLDRARLVADRLHDQLRAANFREILVFQSLPPTTEDGDHQVLPAERLDGFRLELLAERRFGTKLTRLSRLVAVEETALAEATRLGAGPGTPPAAWVTGGGRDDEAHRVK